MKRILALLLVIVTASALGQVNVQKASGTNEISSSLVVGSGKTLTATGTGTIVATGGVAATVPWSGVTGTPTTLAGYGITSPLLATVGGTGQSTWTLGDFLYANGTNTLAKLPGSTSATLTVLTQTGTGTVSAAPAWLSTTGTGNVVRTTSPTLTTPTIDTITAPGNSSLTIAGGGTPGTGTEGRVSLGTGPSGDGYFMPLTWSSGGKYYLTGGHSTFVTAAYPAGIVDNLGGIGYNSLLTPVAGDVQFVLGYESRYQNDPQGVDTEFYYNWNGPIGVTPESGGRSTRRIFQSNTSWGTQYSAPATKKMGFSQIGWDVNKFFVDNGTNFSGSFLLDFTTSPIAMTWQGSFALTNGMTIGGAITQSGTNTNALSGATSIAAANATYAFATGNNSLLTISNESADSALKIPRTGAASTEYLAIGAASGGTIFGGASNAFRFDTVSASGGTLRDLLFRYSSNSGSTYATALTLAHATGTATIGYSTASTDVSNGALVVAGGAGISGTVYAGAFRTTGVVGSYDVSNNASSRLTNSASGAYLRLNSNAVGNEKSVVFSYGATPTVQWNLGNVGYFPSTWIGFNNGIAGGGVMIDGSNNLYLGNTNSAMSGSYNLAVEGGVIDTRTTASLNFKVNGTSALTLANSTGLATFAGSVVTSSATLSGAGAIPITTSLVKFTSTGASQALTLANGTDGQRLTIVHDVDGGSGILTPTTKTGFSTITFTNAGDTVSLVYVTTRGWMVTGSYLATIAP